MNNFDYYNFQIGSVIKKITEEVNFYENCLYCNDDPINEYLLYLKNRIGIGRQETMSMSHYDKSGNKYEIKKMNMDEHTKNLFHDVYTRPWNKLKDFHKMMKIKEYIDNLTYGKKCKPKDIELNKKYLKEEICNGLKNKKFGKNKSEIEYDQEKMVITSISCIDLNKKTGLYEVDWDC